MGKRSAVALDIGGMWTSGDPVAAPQGFVPAIKNLFTRPGRLEKRPQWSRETSDLAITPSAFALYRGSSSDSLILFPSTGTDWAKRASDGTWDAVSATTPDWLGSDYTNIRYSLANGAPNEMYATIRSLNAGGQVIKFDGTTASNVGPTMGGKSITSIVRRLVTGNISVYVLNLLSNPEAYQSTQWTVSGGMANNFMTDQGFTITNGATDVATLAAATVSTEGYYVWHQDFRADSADSRALLTLSITDNAGTTTYAKQEIELPTRTENPDWITYALVARLPVLASAFLIKIQAGVTGRSSPLVSFQTSSTAVDGLRSHGSQVTEGRFHYPFYDKRMTAITVPENVFSYDDRVHFCETDDPTYWRAEGYLDVKEEPGGITAVRATNNSLIVYKKRGAWVFRATDSLTQPFVRVAHYKEFGCVGAKAIEIYENVHFFIGENGVYAWDLQGSPQELCGPAMVEVMFAPSTLVTTPVLAIDQENGEVYCYVREHKIDVYNLQTKRWSYITITGADDAELAIKDLIYAQPEGESERTMWALMSDTNDVVSLDTSGTPAKDNITGTERNVVSEVVLRPFQAGDRSEFTVEEIAMRHKITAAQTNNTFTVSVSRNDGASYGNENVVTVAPLSGGEVTNCPVPVWQTGPRLTLRLRHSGEGGATAFNIYGGLVRLQSRGPEIQTYPTAVSDTL